jgi:hypothetical protein
MLILGLLLVVLSVAAVALLLAYNSAGGPEQMIGLFGRDWWSVNAMEAFVAGLALALLFSLGLWLMVSTGRRMRAARAEYRSARRETRVVAAERDELAEQLAREREAAATTAAPTGARSDEVAPVGADRTGAHRRGRQFRWPHRRTGTGADTTADTSAGGPTPPPQR